MNLHANAALSSERPEPLSRCARKWVGRYRPEGEMRAAQGHNWR
jgi:hypothetical protein